MAIVTNLNTEFVSSSHTNVTLIGSDYFVSAKHFHPGVGSTVKFFSNDTEYSTTISEYVFTVDDITIGKFSTPVPITPIEIWNSDTISYGEHVYSYYQDNTVYERSALAHYSWEGTFLYRDDKISEGDSGAPSFVIDNDQLFLAGIHYGKTSVAAVDSAVFQYRNDIYDFVIIPEISNLGVALAIPIFIYTLINKFKIK